MTREEYEAKKEFYLSRHDGERFYLSAIAELLFDLKEFYIQKPIEKVEPVKRGRKKKIV